MKSKWLFWFLGMFLLNTVIGHAQLNEAFRINNQLYNPWYIHALNDDTLIVYDPINKIKALQLRSVPNGQILRSQRIGRGPGELSAKNTKIINISKEGIFVWDKVLRQLQKYSRGLKYKTSLLVKLPVIYAATLGDSFLFSSTALNSEEFLRLYKIKGDRISDEAVNIYSTKFNKKLYPLKNNFLLKQGPFLVNDGALYMGFDFSSLIIKVTTDSIVYITGQPDYIPLPDFQAVKTNGNTTVTSSPSITKYPFATLDLKVGRNYIYVLHSGKKLDAGRLKRIWLAASGQLEKKVINLKYSKAIYIYNKETGEYLDKLVLPQKAKEIAVSGSYIFALSLNEKGIPVIIAYNKPESF